MRLSGPEPARFEAGLCSWNVAWPGSTVSRYCEDEREGIYIYCFPHCEIAIMRDGAIWEDLRLS
jgi:hypothetical protein